MIFLMVNGENNGNMNALMIGKRQVVFFETLPFNLDF
jgi:hypothetical protein